MRIKLLSTALVSLLTTTTVACVAPADPADDAADDSSTGSGGGSGTSKPGWTAMPLLDDTSNPNRTVYHRGNDLVSGIYFESAIKGFVVTQGAGETGGRGGAVFTANEEDVTSIAFSGDGTGLNLIGSIDFTGIARTPNGYIAMAYANDVIMSRDGGASFQIQKNGNLVGIEPVIGYRVTPSGTTLVRKTGVVDTSPSAPGETMSYTDVWAPNASPSIPASVPLEQCQDGPLGSGVPSLPSSVYISSDRNFIAYTANPEFDPEVCISTDGGQSFRPSSLGVDAQLEEFTPTGVAFTSATTGIAWFAVATAGAYIKRTTDGGATWTDVALPAELASHGISLPAGHFLADGLHGWLAGYDQTAGAALLLETVDGGVTWKTVAGVASAVAAAGGDKLYSVFALDPTHVWIGGARGLLMHN